MMKGQRGVTLLELLIVIVILALLMSLTLGVLHASRKSAYKSVCMNQLKQIGAALLMYRQDHGELPPAQVFVTPYLKETSIFLCPADPFAPHGASFHGNYWAMMYGYSSGLTNSTGFSYAYVREMMTGEHFERLQAADANFGLLACALHDQCDWRGMELPLVDATIRCLDHVLRLRLDLSVQWRPVPMRWYICPRDNAPTGERHGWRLMSDEPCPPDVCFNTTDC